MTNFPRPDVLIDRRGGGLRELEVRLDGCRESWQVLEKIFKPADQVLVHGVNEEIRQDPSCLAICKICDQGQVDINDPKDESRQIYGQIHDSEAGIISGWGNVDLYRRQIEELRQGLEMRLATVGWLGRDSGVAKINSPADKYDVVFDRGTSIYVAEQYKQKGDSSERLFGSFFEEDWRVLKPGGIYVLQHNRNEYQRRGFEFNPRFMLNLGKILEKIGFSVLSCRVEKDVFKMALTESEYQKYLEQIEKAPGNSFFWNLNLCNEVKTEDGRKWLVFEQPFCFLPNFYVARKP
mgnify:CR=1 FL=1